jgi:hypothetical protein
VKKKTEERVNAYAEKHFKGKYTRLAFRYRGDFCYIDAFTEPEEPHEGLLERTGKTREELMELRRNIYTHFCRIKHFSDDVWAFAFFKYSNKKYELSYLLNGSFFGTPAEAFATAAIVYLQ